ncbi:MAG: glutathione S-transferase C-terminal domain-containing protein, partial [Pseudomonadota bacterium]
MERIEPDLQAIAARLSGRAYLFGDAPTAADASLAPMLASGAASPVPTRLSKRIGEDPVLRPYFERVHAALGAGL